jgi:phosphate uptake regulator
MRTVFGQILKMFRGEDPLRLTLEMFAEMIVDCRWMYDQVLEIVTGARTAEEVERELYARDRKINAQEREIRRRLVEYLTISPGPDVAACLVLMSVAKDAERIGDYVKNMFEASVPLRTLPKTDPDLDLSVHQLRSRVLPLFDSARGAFLSSSRTMAQQTLQSAQELAREAEQLVWQIAEREGISSKLSVCYVLSARHVKRISSHLGNIVTAVIQPVDWLDYADEPKAGQGTEQPDEPPGEGGSTT